MSQAVIILQARMASSRLPGKVLARIGTRSMLAHCLERLRLGCAAPVMLATTRNAEDDCLVEIAESHGAQVFRGSEQDVLARYIAAAELAGARYVVRATADNPAIDIEGTARVLDLLRSAQSDYVVEEGLPYGANVEAVTTDALIRAASLATDAADREHVTTLVRRDRTNFTALTVPAPMDRQRPDVRVTVDTERDLLFMRRLAARMGQWVHEPDLLAILDAADALAAEARCA